MKNVPTPPELFVTDYRGVVFVPRSDGRLDLVHEDRPSRLEMQERQAAFLARQGDLTERYFQQSMRGIRERDRSR